MNTKIPELHKVSYDVGREKLKDEFKRRVRDNPGVIREMVN